MNRQRPLGLGTHIFVSDADAAVAFYSEAFGATELIRHRLPDGRVLFVEMAVGPDKLLLSEEIPELHALAPSTLGGSPVMLLLELDDVRRVRPCSGDGRRGRNGCCGNVLGRAIRHCPRPFRTSLVALHAPRTPTPRRGSQPRAGRTHRRQLAEEHIRAAQRLRALLGGAIKDVQRANVIDAHRAHRLALVRDSNAVAWDSPAPSARAGTSVTSQDRFFVICPDERASA